MTIEQIKKSIQCCYESDCVNCPNNCELGSGELVCLYRLLPKVETCINELQQQLTEKDKEIKRIRKNWKNSKIQQTRLYNNLKTQLHTQPREIIEKIKKKLENTSKSIFQDCLWLGYQTILDKLDEILKEYEEEIK